MAERGRRERRRLKRRSWSKWVFAALVAFWAATGGGWVYWNHTANRMLDEQIERIRSAGDPLEFSALAPEPVPDEQNAVLLYARAWAKLTGEEESAFWPEGHPESRRDDRPERRPEWRRQTRPATRPAGERTDRERRERLLSMIVPLAEHAEFRREHAEELKQLLALAEEPLRLCREARDRPEAWWKLDYSGPALDVMLPSVGHLRELGRLERLAAVVAHERGDDAEAVAHVRDMLRIARAAETSSLLISHLVALGVHEAAWRTVEQVAPDLRVGGEAGAAGGGAVRTLAADMLNARLMREHFARAFVADRSIGYDTIERFRREPASARAMTANASGHVPAALGPLLKVDEALYLRYSTVYVEAAKAASYPAAIKVLSNDPAVDIDWSGLEGLAHPLARLLLPALGRAYEMHWRAEAQRRLAATALAVRLYELDRGRRPATLGDLVPEYLDSVPSDPFAPGRSVRYVPDSDPPLLYCAGEDGSDDGGTYATTKSGAYDTETSTDLVFFLDGDRPRGEADWEDPTSRRASYGRRRRRTFTVGGGPPRNSGSSASSPTSAHRAAATRPSRTRPSRER